MGEDQTPLTRDEILRGHRAIQVSLALASAIAVAAAVLVVAQDQVSAGLTAALLAVYFVVVGLWLRWFASRRDELLEQREAELAGERPLPPVD